MAQDGSSVFVFLIHMQLSYSLVVDMWTAAVFVMIFTALCVAGGVGNGWAIALNIPPWM